MRLEETVGLFPRVELPCSESLAHTQLAGRHLSGSWPQPPHPWVCRRLNQLQHLNQLTWKLFHPTLSELGQGGVGSLRPVEKARQGCPGKLKASHALAWGSLDSSLSQRLTNETHTSQREPVAEQK